MSTEKVAFVTCPWCGELAYEFGGRQYTVEPAIGMYSYFRCHSCDSEFPSRVTEPDERPVHGYDQTAENDINSL